MVPRNSNSFDSIYTAPAQRDKNALAAQIFALKEDKSLASDDKFSELMKKKGDVHFWVNTEAIMSGIPEMAAMGMLNVSKLYEGSRMAGAVNFDNGKIDVDMKSYSGKEMSELWKKYQGDNINGEIVKRIPSKNVAGLIVMNFKPELIREFLKVAGMEGLANMGAAQAGLSVDDFIKALKGDILFAVTDVQADSTSKPDATFIFAASVNDKNSMSKLINVGNQFIKGKMNPNQPPPIAYNMAGNYFAIGNKQTAVDTYLNTNSNTSFDFYDKISGSPMGLYVNLQYILNAFHQVASGGDSVNLKLYTASVQMWDNIVGKGGEFRDGGMVQHFEINLVNKNENSLKQLYNYLGTMAGYMKMKKSLRNPVVDAGIMKDTTVVSTY
jgi:hypothetical protein